MSYKINIMVLIYLFIDGERKNPENLQGIRCIIHLIIKYLDYKIILQV